MEWLFALAAAIPAALSIWDDRKGIKICADHRAGLLL